MVLFVCLWAHIMIICMEYANFLLQNKQSKTCVMGTQKKRLIEILFKGGVYSPAAIIRNAKIGNIILLHGFFRTLSINLDLEYPTVSEENCLKKLVPLP